MKSFLTAKTWPDLQNASIAFAPISSGIIVDHYVMSAAKCHLLNPTADLKACFNCHKPQDKQDFVFSYDKLKVASQ